jgi:putative sigma-54 modulation protein
VNITVTARHMELTDAIRDYCHEKAELAIVEPPRVESVHVILNVEKYRHIAEVVVQAANHVKVEAAEESDDLYLSIDGAFAKAAKQLRKAREKITDHRAQKLGEMEAGGGEANAE